MAEGACRHLDPALFFPWKGQPTGGAKKVCAGCRVREPCLEYSLAIPERFGIWGGLTEGERRRLRRSRRRAADAATMADVAVDTDVPVTANGASAPETEQAVSLPAANGSAGTDAPAASPGASGRSCAICGGDLGPKQTTVCGRRCSSELGRRIQAERRARLQSDQLRHTLAVLFDLGAEVSLEVGAARLTARRP